ncbi:hypothetical protein M426DRAFT_318542 [Hypoxylon sp. CI-4A]|nr:hypothetical protein M426DRAFT_318542 [Hypoxylon sp. CI-4A]
MTAFTLVPRRRYWIPAFISVYLAQETIFRMFSVRLLEGIHHVSRPRRTYSNTSNGSDPIGSAFPGSRLATCMEVLTRSSL